MNSAVIFTKSVPDDVLRVRHWAVGGLHRDDGAHLLVLRVDLDVEKVVGVDALE